MQVRARTGIPYPTIPLVGGPFDGQRRPIIDGYVPDLLERLPHNEQLIQVYDLKTDQFGAHYYAYKCARPIEIKG